MRLATSAELIRESGASAAALPSPGLVARALSGAGAALCARAQGALASRLSATAARARPYAVRVICRNRFAIDFPVKARLGPQRRVGTDRGQNVAGQFKRIDFKAASAVMAESQSRRVTTANRLISWLR